MLFPEVFYYSQTVTADNYSRQVTGTPDINRMLKSKPCWLLPTFPRYRKQKKLIFADWRSKDWSSEKKANIEKELQLITEAGFSVYIWQDGEMNLLKPDNPAFAQTAGEVKRTLATHDEIISKAAQKGIARDQLHLLDSHGLQCIFNENFTLPHSLSIADFCQVTINEYKKVLEIIKHSTSPLKHIIHDKFSDEANRKVKLLQKQFPDCEIKTAYRELELNKLHMDALLRLEQFKDIEVIALGGIDGKNLQTLLEAAPKLKKLNLERCAGLEGIFSLASKLLPELESFHLSDSSINTDNLQALLKAAPKLKNLNLTKNALLKDNLSLVPQSLSALERLDLSYTSINVTSLQTILLAAPKLKKLQVMKCEALLEGILTLAPQSLSELEKLHLTMTPMNGTSLQVLLRAAPNLKELNFHFCKGLSEGILSLTPQSLPELENLDLWEAHIMPAAFQALLLAAPKLKRLDWHYCENLAEGTLLPKSLPELESLELKYTFITAHTLQTFLQAAPNLKELYADLSESLKLNPQSLAKLEALYLTNSNLTTNPTGLQTFLQAAPKLKTLSLRGYTDLSAILPLLNSKNLTELEWLHLNVKNLYPADLQTIFLQLTPKLKGLELGFCKNLPERFELDIQTLPGFEKLNLYNTHIKAGSLQALLKKMPNLKSLDLSFCRGLSEDIILDSASLMELEVLELLSSSISLQNLQAFLQAALKLKTINLARCKGLSEGLLSLESQTLCELEVLNLHESAITAVNLQALLNAAPNLISITLDDKLQITAELKKRLAKIPFVKSYSYQNFGGEGLGEHYEDPKHNYVENKNNKPPSDDFVFKFKGKNKTYNQGMIIEKLSQYLQLTKQHLTVIPKLQHGICNALTHFRKDIPDWEWHRFSYFVSDWDGTLAKLHENLKQEFDRLYEYIKEYQLKPSKFFLHFLGDNVTSDLNQMPVSNSKKVPEAYILTNPWHAITVHRKAADSWEIYDPNYINGPKEVTRSDLPVAIENCIGQLVCIESAKSAHKIPPKLKNPNDFIEMGGLLALCFSDNRDALLTQLRSHETFTKKALDGLLLRDVMGKPAWFWGLNHNNEAIAALTQTLLTQFKQENPTNYQRQLQQSLEAITNLERHDLLSRLKVLFTQSKNRLQPNLEESPDKPALNPQENLFDLIRSASLNRSDYTHDLQTWRKTKPIAKTLSEYCQSILRKEPGKKHLIEVHSSEALDTMGYALRQHCKNTSRPLFYIDKPEDLVCSSPFMHRHADNSGELREGPGGPLYDFLQAQHAGQSPVLLVNYESFNADEMVLFNDLLEKKRRIDGVELPEAMLVVGLINLAKPDCYQGSDFYSRWSKKEVCPFSDSQLNQYIPGVAPVTSAPVQGKKFMINLYSAPDWQSRLLGRWRINGHSFVYEKGELVKALETGLPIEIQNGLWEDRKFKRFWQRLQREGLLYEGANYPLPSLSRQEGYDWAGLKSCLEINPGLSSEANPVLNLGTLTDFFEGYQCNEADKTLKPKHGLIEAAKVSGYLSVNVTHSLNDEAWAMVLDACQRCGVRLIAHCAAGVQLPEGLSAHNPAVTATAIWNPAQNHAPTQVIISDDADTTVASLTETTQDWQVIDVTECRPYDLLSRLSVNFNHEALTFEFTQTDCALLNTLNANGKVILKGHFSPELRDALAPLILARQQKNNASTGQLIIVSEDGEPFAYAPLLFSHSVTAREKRAHLGPVSTEILAQLAPFMTEPLSKLRARCEFLQRNPPASSDKAWEGMNDLPVRGAVLPSVDITAEAFLESRLQAVNAVLDQSPFVFLTGLSGVGKSTFVEKELGQNDDVLYVGEAKILDWVKSDIKGRKILFLDEANLSSRQWTEFEGLFHSPAGFLIEGIFYPLTPEHKVVFAGNPVSYGDERQLASFFQRHGRAVLFTPLAPAVIKDKVLMPILQNELRLDDAKKVMDYLLNVYRFVCGCSTTEVLLSPRELQMMALLTLNRLRQQPECDAKTVIQDVAFQLTQPLVPNEHRQAFAQQFNPPNEAKRPVTKVDDLNNYLLTPSRHVIHQQLKERLQLREWRYEQAERCNEEQKYGGLGGVIIEGGPGIGKSELVLNTLLSSGYEEEHHLKQPTTKTKPFYRMPASMALSDKKNLLLKAFDEGAVVIVDEINSSPMMEPLLNALLMGKNLTNERPKQPGFMVIGTQNPISMAGRRVASTALQRRLTTIELPEYSQEEMKTILIAKGCTSDKADLLVDVYAKELAYAKAHHLEPAPCFRDVLKAEENIRMKETSIEEIQEESNNEITHEIDNKEVNEVELPWKKLWRESYKYRHEKSGFQKIWDDSRYSTQEQKIIALLKDYSKSNTIIARFFVAVTRHHVNEVNEICLDNQRQTLTDQKLFNAIAKIKLINSKGTLATLIDFLEEKGFQRDEGMLNEPVVNQNLCGR